MRPKTWREVFLEFLKKDPRRPSLRWKAMLLARRTSSSFPQKARWARRDGELGWTITVPRSLHTHSRGSPKSSFVSFTSCYSQGVYFFTLPLLLLFFSYFSLFISSLTSLSFFFPLFAIRFNWLPRQVVHGSGGEPRLWQFISNLMNELSVVIVVIG